MSWFMSVGFEHCSCAFRVMLHPTFISSCKQDFCGWKKGYRVSHFFKQPTLGISIAVGLLKLQQTLHRNFIAGCKNPPIQNGPEYVRGEGGGEDEVKISSRQNFVYSGDLEYWESPWVKWCDQKNGSERQSFN